MAEFGTNGAPLGACAACGAAAAPGERFCERCSTVASDLTPAIDTEARVDHKSGTIAKGVREVDILAPGTELGAYRIVELLGSGGIGHVYVADYMRLGRRVALKKLRSHYDVQPEIVSRFFAEARAANRIAHENIVQITDFIEDEVHGSFLIMELLKGSPLDVLIEREGKLPLQRVLHIATQVTSALAAAHERGVVHRDLKPENIFLCEHSGDPDFVKVLDFGAAKLTGDAGAASGHTTASGAVVGTPAYMSPEQGVGRNVDHRTDAYALGVILFEMLTGQLPFAGETLGELIIQHTTVTPRSPRELRADIPPSLEALVMRCLRKQPDERPASMTEIGEELTAIAGGRNSVRPEYLSLAPEAPVAQPKAKIPLVIVAAVLVAFVILSSTVAWLALSGEEAPVEQAAAAAVVEPAPAAAEPATVSVSITSDPSGAQAWLEGATEPLGVTPFTATFPQGSHIVVVEVRAEGRQSVRHDVRLLRDSEVHVMLPLAPQAPTKQPTVSRPRNRRRAVIDPFQ